MKTSFGLEMQCLGRNCQSQEFGETGRFWKINDGFKEKQPEKEQRWEKVIPKIGVKD